MPGCASSFAGSLREAVNCSAALAADRSGRESIASQALKGRTEGSDSLSEFIAMLTTHPEQQERFMRGTRTDRRRGDYGGSGKDRSTAWGDRLLLLEPRMIAQLVIRILAVLQLPPYAQNVILAT